MFTRALAVGATFWMTCGLAQAASITPTRFDDPTSGGNACLPSPTDCSLRNAIAAVGGAGGPTVLLQPGAYELNQPTPQSGAKDLVVQSGWHVTIVGAGARSTTIRQDAAASNTSNVIENDGTLTLAGLTVTGGYVFGDGGGILNTGTLVVDQVAITGNVAQDLSTIPMTTRGGGIASSGTGSLTVTRSTISENQVISGAATYGGGISSSDPLIAVNDTINGNSVASGGGAGGGGGVSLSGSSATAALSNVTLAGNGESGAGLGGGNLDVEGGATARLRDTLVAQGTGSGGVENCRMVGGTISSSGYNLEDRNQCGLTGAGDQTGTNPLLGVLANNGGPTDTEPIAPPSPAVDGGNPAGCTDQVGAPITADQRGTARPQGTRCDIGAFEYVPSSGGGGSGTGGSGTGGSGTGGSGTGGSGTGGSGSGSGGSAGGGSGGSGGGSGGGAGSSAGSTTVSLAGRPKTTGNGVIFKLKCSAPAGRSCETTNTLTTIETLKSGKPVAVAAAHTPKKRKRTVVVGRKSMTIPSGRTKSITITLNGQGRKLLKRFKRLPVTLVVKLLSNGNPRVAVKRKLTIKPKKKQHARLFDVRF